MSKAIDNRVSETAIRHELDRILQSPMFVQSERLSRFLRYTVEHVIAGQENGLKEYVIGAEVYDRKPPYHPSQDSIVRTEARRLRSKLKEYYEVEGKEDSIFIFFRPGSYVPVFRMKDSDATYQVVVDDVQAELFVHGAGVSIAVLPFLDLSGQSHSSKYALGVTDELIHELMQSEGCRVVSANSIAQLGAQAADIPALAQKLGVQLVFEGTVREEANRIRVTGRIVNADGFQLWSQRLDAEGTAANLFEVQEQFACALVSRVRPQQSIVLSARASVSPHLLSVYPNLLKGEALLDEATIPNVEAALAKFREVAQLAPGYGRCFCGLARCHLWMALAGGLHSYRHIAPARTAVERALELDPQMAAALTSLGSVQALEGQRQAAEATFRKAVEHRSHADASRQFGLLLTRLGRFDEACQQLEHAQRIDPFSSQQKVARATFFYLSRRFAEALQHLTEPLRYGPLPLEAQLYLALIYAETGKPEMAQKLAQQAQHCTGVDAPLLGWIAEIYARSQHPAVAESICEKFALLSHNAEMSKYRQSRLATALNRQHEAMALLSASCAEKEPDLLSLGVDPGFDPLRRLPQFSALLKAM